MKLEIISHAEKDLRNRSIERDEGRQRKKGRTGLDILLAFYLIRNVIFNGSSYY